MLHLPPLRSICCAASRSLHALPPPSPLRRLASIVDSVMSSTAPAQPLVPVDGAAAGVSADAAAASSGPGASTLRLVLLNLSLFALAGLLEIGGGWLYWRYFRLRGAWWCLLLGASLLLVYGWIPTLQPSGLEFGRTYAVYGGMFIVMSVAWGWAVDGNKPDKGGQCDMERGGEERSCSVAWRARLSERDEELQRRMRRVRQLRRVQWAVRCKQSGVQAEESRVQAEHSRCTNVRLRERDEELQRHVLHCAERQPSPAR